MTRKQGYQYRRLVLLMLLIFSFCLTGCSGIKDRNGSKKADDGRTYGGTIEGGMKDTLETAFFDITVEQAVSQETCQFEDSLYQAESGNTYLAVTVTIRNTYEKNLPMSITDFTLDYDDSEGPGIVGFGRTELKQDEFMENVFTLKKGEQVTKSILFYVEQKESYDLKYKEYYEDEFEGNEFVIHFNSKEDKDN